MLIWTLVEKCRPLVSSLLWFVLMTLFMASSVKQTTLLSHSLPCNLINWLIRMYFGWYNSSRKAEFFLLRNQNSPEWTTGNHTGFDLKNSVLRWLQAAGLRRSKQLQDLWVSWCDEGDKVAVNPLSKHRLSQSSYEHRTGGVGVITPESWTNMRKINP